MPRLSIGTLRKIYAPIKQASLDDVNPIQVEPPKLTRAHRQRIALGNRRKAQKHADSIAAIVRKNQAAHRIPFLGLLRARVSKMRDSRGGQTVGHQPIVSGAGEVVDVVATA